MILFWVWGIVTAACLIFELINSKLISLWFVFGGLINLLVIAFVPKLHILMQLCIFIGSSALLLLTVRKPCLKLINADNIKKHSHLIGKHFVVENTTDDYTYHTFDGVCWRIYPVENMQFVPGFQYEICSVGINKLTAKLIEVKSNKQ